MRCPIIAPVLVIADDARLAAQIACRYVRAGFYLPVVDGPRLGRPDAQAEVIRRSNAAARARSRLVILAGLGRDSVGALSRHIPSRITQCVETSADIVNLESGFRSKSPPLRWGQDRIGIGLLKALRAQTDITFTEEFSPAGSVPSKSSHLVVCEDGNELSQVIAANYAYALRAGLCIIPEVVRDKSEHLLERLYGLYDDQHTSPTQSLAQVMDELRRICGPLPVPPRGSITFITGELPYGFAFPDSPSTHLFTYPDLGIAIINGFAAEQKGNTGISVAALVDPETTDAPEIDAATKQLPPRGIFVRRYCGPGADVRSISRMIELFPYDLLLIATHCGDAPGHRWTYEFDDSEGIHRELIVDIALGIGRTDHPDLFNVTEFIRFHALDGIDWHDPDKSEKLYVGTAIRDFTDSMSGQPQLEPVRKEIVSRVIGSAVLKMYDNNYIALPRTLAGHGTPIVINNACGSWHGLASRLTNANARAYIGTLFPVATSEAHDIFAKLIGNQFGRPLPLALWSAQRATYGSGTRRPYVMAGVYPQRLRATNVNVPRTIERRLLQNLTAQRRMFEKVTLSAWQIKEGKEQIDFLERELADVRERWINAPVQPGLNSREVRA